MKQSTQISIQNTSTSRAFIQVFHKNEGGGIECGGWYAAPGVTVGPLTVSFEDSFGNVDWWSVYVLLLDGPLAGRFTLEGSEGWVACDLRNQDISNPPVLIMDGKSLQIKLYSGATARNLAPLPGAIAGLGSASPITNVFVLMLENHSFDNMFAKCGIKGVDVATANDSNMYNGTKFPVTSPAPARMPTDPGHEFEDVVQQLTGVPPPQKPTDPPNYPPSSGSGLPGGPYPKIDNSGFAANYATSTTEAPHKPPPLADVSDIMACFNCDQIPNLSYLAQKYVICDRWFSSMPGPTWPNRLFLHGGSSGGLDHSLAPFDIITKETLSGFSYPTTAMNPQGESVFDRLSAKNLSWRLYIDKSGPVSGSFAQVSALKGISVSSPYDLSDLESDLQAPYPYVYTFIEPNYGDSSTNENGSSQHPIDDAAGGDRLVATVFNAIAQSPLWKSSLLIIVYDEHGGFYDHVASGPAVDPEAGSQSYYNQSGFDWKLYGVRVPAIIVSPLVIPPPVDSTLYDHTSVLATLNDLFGMGSLTQRDARANSLKARLWDPKASANPPDTIDQPPTLLPVKLVAAPTFRVSSSPDRRAQVAKQPLPDKGNICGMLGVAMKAEYELSNGTPAEQQAILAKARTLKTKGEAQAYMESVMSRVRAREQQLNQK